MVTITKAVKSHSASEPAIAEVVNMPVPATKFVKTYDVLIVGAGPAGAYCGYCLARQGVQTIILDHSHPREKPCGGVLSNRVFKKFPLIQAIPYTSDVKNPLQVTAPSGQKVLFERDRGHSISRRALDRYLLDSAIRLGCKFVPEEAMAISSENGLWTVKTRDGEFRGRILIGADGTRSIVRKQVASPFNREDLAIGIGYLAIESKRSTSQIKFNNHGKGFSWKGNRETHCSIGTIDSLTNAAAMKTVLEEFLLNECSDAHPFARWSALVPRASSADFFSAPRAGRNWALIGDAAGHVHPMTGEGILYALWSAELASQAIYSGDTRLFDSLWREEYGKELQKAVVAQKILYNKNALDTSLWFSARSSTLSDILHSVWSGELHPGSAWLRTLYNVPLIGFETAREEFRRAFS